MRWRGATMHKLPEALAAGQIVNQMYQRIAYESIRGTARAAIASIKRHRGYELRPPA